MSPLGLSVGHLTFLRSKNRESERTRSRQEFRKPESEPFEIFELQEP